MKTPVLKVRKVSEVAAAAQAGADLIRSGGLVGFATETVYGIAALASNVAAMERLRELKSRPARPFSLHIGKAGDVGKYVAHIPKPAQTIIAKGWPGPVTILLPVGGQLADGAYRRAKLYDVLCSDDTIGIRYPDEPVAAAMLAAVDGPVVAPSANLAGQPSPRSAQDVLDLLDGRIDLLIDSGQTKYGKDSTIVSFAPQADWSDSQRQDGWAVVRKGVYDERTIHRLATRKILFICTGNTCRSPMAAGLARKLLSDHLGVSPADLKKHGIEVISAGLFAGEGSRATPEAVAAARRLGADISRHHSRPADSDLIYDADMVFCMTEAHVVQARRVAPKAADKIRRLDSRCDIPDPIGGGQDVYQETAERIGHVLKDLLEKGTL